MKWTRVKGPDGRFIDLPDAVRRLAVKLASQHLVSLKEVLFGRAIGRRTSKSLAYARHELWVITMDKHKLSYPETGKLFGVNYTSVIRGRKEYEARSK